MAKPGDIVEFKTGLHGLDAPQNIGIVLRRERRKGVPWVKLATVGGVLEIKQEHLSRRAFRDRYDGDVRETEDAVKRVRFLAKQNEEGGLAEEAEDDLGALEQALWEATAPDGRSAWTEEAIAQAHYGEAPSPTQTKQVRAALDRCRRAGTGRFETVAGRGDTWRPWTPEQKTAMDRAWSSLGDLRAKLVRVEEGEDGRLFRRVSLTEAGLDDADDRALAWIKAAMVQFVEHDGVPDGAEAVAGIGGMGAVQAFGMDLHRNLGFLAQDWISSEHTSRSSDYIHFLLEAGLWSSDDAVQSLMRRHVNQEPFFEHVPDEEAEALAQALPRPHEEQDPSGPAGKPGDGAAGDGMERDGTAGDGAEGDRTAVDGAPERRDLRHLECYTIDPPDAEDFDDAVGIEELGDGRRRLWVHIADVSHYVRPGSRLDKHAKDRATSVYLPGRVLPMLPTRLSDDLCSLRDDGDRHALSVALDIDADGKIEGATFDVGLIRVDENLAYAEALRRRDEGHAPFPALFELATRMRRHRRGLELETGELKVLLEESGFSALEKRADDATRMIETFMVAANEAVARHLADAGVPFLYRCHPLPDAQKAERFGHQMETIGYDVAFELPETARAGTREAAQQSLLDRRKSGGGKMELFGGGMELAQAGRQGTDADESDPGASGDGAGDAGAGDQGEGQEGKGADASAPTGFAALDEDEREAWLAPFREVVDELAQDPDAGRAEVATFKLLACMGQAYYTPQNEGHFGLGSTHYCHFTSPIRRYPDLVVHRNLKALIARQAGPAAESRTAEGTGTGPDLPHAAEDLQRMCDHCSEQERAAAALERRVRSACLVLASMQGEASGEARITGITPASIFIRRPDGIEARVPARDLPGGPYHVDEWGSMLYLGEREAPERFCADDLRAWSQWVDEELGERRIVRATLADKVTARLAGRDVAEGRTGAEISAW